MTALKMEFLPPKETEISKSNNDKNGEKNKQLSSEIEGPHMKNKKSKTHHISIC